MKKILCLLGLLFIFSSSNPIEIFKRRFQKHFYEKQEESELKVSPKLNRAKPPTTNYRQNHHPKTLLLPKEEANNPSPQGRIRENSKALKHKDEVMAALSIGYMYHDRN